jgi:hypothetical protein
MKSLFKHLADRRNLLKNAVEDLEACQLLFSVVNLEDQNEFLYRFAMKILYIFISNSGKSHVVLFC